MRTFAALLLFLSLALPTKAQFDAAYDGLLAEALALIEVGKVTQAYELIALSEEAPTFADLQPVIEQDPLLAVAVLDIENEGRCQILGIVMEEAGDDINHPEEIAGGLIDWTEVITRVNARSVHSVFAEQLADDELSFDDLFAGAASSPQSVFAKMVLEQPGIDWLAFRAQVRDDPYFAFLAHGAVGGVVGLGDFDKLIAVDPFIALASLRVGLQVADLVSRVAPDLKSSQDIAGVAALVEQEPLSGLGYLRLSVLVADQLGFDTAAAANPRAAFIALGLNQRVYSHGGGLWNEGGGYVLGVDDGGRIGFVGFHDIGSSTGREAGELTQANEHVPTAPWLLILEDGVRISETAVPVGEPGSGIADIDGVADIDGLAAQFVTRDGIHAADAVLSWSEAYEMTVSEPLIGLNLLRVDVGALVEGSTGVRCVP
ncbi:MAG: hypothetical protein AAF533_27915 [Acidobacteriota bacterium]